jgi:hypothetical protein
MRCTDVEKLYKFWRDRLKATAEAPTSTQANPFGARPARFRSVPRFHSSVFTMMTESIALFNGYMMWGLTPARLVYRGQRAISQTSSMPC